ncbi:MAG: excinuclease ABC subunit A [Pseudomonadota bacterium]
MTHASSILALRVASAVLIGFGILNLLALATPLAGVMDLFIDFAFLPVDDAQVASTEAAHLWIGISGGLMAGWGVMIWQVTGQVYAIDQSAGRSIILPGILTWFVIDGLGSALAGAPFNAVVNVVFLVLFVWPVLAVERDGPVVAGS